MGIIAMAAGVDEVIFCLADGGWLCARTLTVFASTNAWLLGLAASLQENGAREAVPKSNLLKKKKLKTRSLIS